MLATFFFVAGAAAMALDYDNPVSPPSTTTSSCSYICADYVNGTLRPSTSTLPECH
jgi:hypothetical protein